MATSPSVTERNLSALTAHQWSPQPEPARLVIDLLSESRSRSPWLNWFAQRLLDETGTRLLDWVDHIALPKSDPVLSRLEAVGYEPDKDMSNDVAWQHRGGLFPRIRAHSGLHRQIALKVDSVSDFLAAQDLSNVTIEGPCLASIRRACVTLENDVEPWVIERHGSRAFEANPNAVVPLEKIARHFEVLRLRQRAFENDSDGFELATRLVIDAISDLGRDRACELFFAAERDYWQRRNRAGRIQKARQDSLGIGWANHDHHTYRSSRASFARLIAFLERLGFQLRERFYAGREAGWGAQVIEHPVTGITIFADVDLSPEEVSDDFSHQPLPPRDELGTVGLWCALHGEAFLQAGLHHLECQFDFDATRDQLSAVGIETMPPFTDLPYLRQAFTRGEIWPVNPQRVERLLSANRITREQAQQFLSHGALGSHLEILQRDDGYKGFNQRGINEIISATDPRRAQR